MLINSILVLFFIVFSSLKFWGPKEDKNIKIAQGWEPVFTKTKTKTPKWEIYKDFYQGIKESFLYNFKKVFDGVSETSLDGCLTLLNSRGLLLKYWEITDLFILSLTFILLLICIFILTIGVAYLVYSFIDKLTAIHKYCYPEVKFYRFLNYFSNFSVFLTCFLPFVNTLFAWLFTWRFFRLLGLIFIYYIMYIQIVIWLLGVFSIIYCFLFKWSNEEFSFYIKRGLFKAFYRFTVALLRFPIIYFLINLNVVCLLTLHDVYFNLVCSFPTGVPDLFNYQKGTNGFTLSIIHMIAKDTHNLYEYDIFTCLYCLQIYAGIRYSGYLQLYRIIINDVLPFIKYLELNNLSE